MRPKIQYSIFLILIAFLLNFNSYSQKLDLIVSTAGDSIACFTDSITIEKIYFKEMKEYEWVSNSLNKNQIKEHKTDAFKNVSIVFEPGTSHIIKTIPIKPILSIKDINKNSVYAELAGNGGGLMSLNYDRIFPLSNSLGIVTRGGIAYLLMIGELTFIYGGPRHYIETGAGCSSDFDFYVFDFRLGYRFHGYNGIVVRAAPLLDYNKFSDNNNPWTVRFGLSLGYSF